MKSDPDLIKRAVVLREAGFSLASVAAKTGLSASTLYRTFKKAGVKCGGINQEALDAARNELLNDAGFVNDLKHTIAASIVDDIMVARKTREVITLTLDQLVEEQGKNKASLADLSLRARSLAALVTSLSVTQTVARKALNIDAETYAEEKELPTLTICKMTDEEMEAVKNRFNDPLEDE